MNTEVLREIDALKQKRLEIAKTNRGLARLELERKKLQVAIAREYRTEINPATGKVNSEQAANDLSRTDSRYAVMIDAIANETEERDVALAEAESIRLFVELNIAAMQSAGIAA